MLADFIDFFWNKFTAKKQRVKMCGEGGGSGRLTEPMLGKAAKNFLKWFVPVVYVFFDEVARALVYKSKTVGARVSIPLRMPKS